MNSYQYVVIVGAPLEQQTIYGPFSSFDEAAEWDLRLRNEFSWIITLESPR